MTIYKSKCVLAATYGSRLWGIGNCLAIQRQENIFLRKVLAVPQSIPSTMIHDEVGLSHIMDLIAIRPLLVWWSIWSKGD